MTQRERETETEGQRELRIQIGKSSERIITRHTPAK